MAESRPLTTGSIATIGAYFVTAVGKILSVFLSVAVDAKSDAVIGQEAEFGKISKRFNMVSVYLPVCLVAFLAKIIITLEYFISPFPQLVGLARAFPFKRLTLLKGWSKLTKLVFMGTITRAIFARSILSVLKFYPALKACAIMRIALVPTFLATVFGSRGTEKVLLILATANYTSKHYSFPSFHNWLTFNCWHNSIIAYFDTQYKYVMENFTGEKAELVNG